MTDHAPFALTQDRTVARAIAGLSAASIVAMPAAIVAAALSGAPIGFVFIAMPTLAVLTVVLFTRFSRWILPVIEGRVARWALRLDPSGLTYNDGEDVVRLGWGGYEAVTTDAEIGARGRSGTASALCLVRPGARLDRTLADRVRARLAAAPLRVSTVSGVTILPFGFASADAETILAAARDLHAATKAHHRAPGARTAEPARHSVPEAA